MLAIRALCVLMLIGAYAATTASATTRAIPGDHFLSASDVIADIDLAEDAYARIHPGYTRYTEAILLADAWEGLRERARRSDGMSAAELYLALSRVLTLIRCDHTKAELPKALREGRADAPLYLPLRWEWIEGRALVRYVPESLGLSAGDELLAIDGVSVTERVREVEGLVPVDGYTDHARAGEMGVSLEFMGGAVDHFGALLHPPPPQARLTVRTGQDDARQVQVSRVDHASWSTLVAEAGVASNFKDAVTFERIGEQAAYLRVDTFVNYRTPIDPHSLYGPIFQALADEQRDTLILDLRRNGGGSNDAAQGLLAYLINSPQRMHTDMRVSTLDFQDLRPYLSTWDKRALNPNRLGFRKHPDGTYSLRAFVSDDLQRVRPKRPYFGGQLLVLIGADNSSGSTNLAAVLAEQARTRLIGEATGGSYQGPTAGLLFTLTLPNSGIRSRLPFFRYYNNVSSAGDGRGLAPEVLVPRTFDAERQRRDAALAAALALASAP